MNPQSTAAELMIGLWAAPVGASYRREWRVAGRTQSQRSGDASEAAQDGGCLVHLLAGGVEVRDQAYGARTHR
jgi:hypothetical protein